MLLDVLATIAGVEINVSYRRDFAAAALEPSLLAARTAIHDLTIPIGRAGGGSNPVASKMLSQGNEEPSARDRRRGGTGAFVEPSAALRL